MAQGFKSTPQGYSASFNDEEVKLMVKLFKDVALTLEPEPAEGTDELAELVGITEDPQVPLDPAVARMLPVASDDPEVADEFRRYTERTLREMKIGHLKMAAVDIEAKNVVLNEEHAQAWAAALNDVRLTLGSRLDISSDADAEAVAAHDDWRKVQTVEDYMSLVYNFVTWLQDTLMEAMLTQLDDSSPENTEGRP